VSFQRTGRGGAILFLVLALVAPLAAKEEGFYPEIDPAKGADDRVDYAELVRFGPWDDRNYDLTREDLELLSPNEEELQEPIPAFYRVLLRRSWPELQSEGPAQYPRSAPLMFRSSCGGFLYRGRIYTQVTRTERGWRFSGAGEPACEDDYPECRAVGDDRSMR
jgi:hypothetical protein